MQQTTQKNQQLCAKMCRQPLGLHCPQQQHVEGDLGKSVLTLFASDRSIGGVRQGTLGWFSVQCFRECTPLTYKT